MGAQLVGKAFAFASRVTLKPNEKLLLLWMSLTALDSDNPPRYFAARESSALALGRMVPDAPPQGDPNAPAIEAERAAAFQRVKIATQGLVQAGAIRNARRGREGTRAEYVLTFGTESVPLESTENVPLSGSESVPPRGRNPYPRGTTEEHKEQPSGESRHPAPPHFWPVDNSKGERIAV
ncbi:hypothetical protein G3T36_10640 [Diaminobutyricibacter tongyongensis]|uniref:Uncharacterized protein n=1 Tax=Leifsonia tongyongensis TaxID=1268043 RepID=A0A6L9XY53_9MICO|nr:hypothetical protein [Diaminobutyricibacter tongyongensis]NEN06333.1 hypothetical protein [Diaminobutyricibacter tongyongensis]